MVFRCPVCNLELLRLEKAADHTAIRTLADSVEIIGLTKDIAVVCPNGHQSICRMVTSDRERGGVPEGARRRAPVPG